MSFKRIVATNPCTDAMRSAHRDLGGAVAREQDVGALQVQVHDLAAVHVVQPARDVQRHLPPPAVPEYTYVHVRQQHGKQGLSSQILLVWTQAPTLR